MKNQIEIFKNNELGEVRTLFIDGDYWFIGKDVAKCLGYKDENRAIIKMEKTLKELENIPNLEIIGSGKCVIEMIASKYRYQILLRSQSHTPLLKASQVARFYGALPDIDPVNFN